MARSLSQYAAHAAAFAILCSRSASAFTILALALWLVTPPSARADTSCAEWHAELTVVEGTVDVKRAGESVWAKAASGASLCYGDAVSVKASGRATLTLPDHSTLRLDENTTITLVEPKQSGASLIDLVRGAIHVISRDPRSLKFTTPYANAGLEGTEFDIRVNDREPQTEVVVLEGKVAMSTPTGDLGVPSGQIAVARAGQAPSAQPLREAIDLMRWTGHYPRILDRPLPGADQAAPTTTDADFFAQRAAARLETARVDAATADLEAALRLAPAQPTALALQALIALARADHATAMRLATEATAAPTASAAAWLALSYSQQGVADLDGATASAAHALRLEPDNALALSRVAALDLANGDVGVSIEHATRAARLAPARAEPPTVLGFAYLSLLDSAAARSAFDSAVALDPPAPLPRLGRGLALIQIGDLIDGRQQLELAVALDPTNALARSYMAKVYETENRAKLTGSQIDLAKRFDQFDPTPWLYAALQKLRANRPVEAFQELQAATMKNGDRVALRSRLPVDADLATRSSGIARVDGELGFDRLAVNDARQAVTDRPSDYAGHRQLADAYSREPREEIARVSESFVAQLLQPANLTPIPAQLGQPSTFLAAHLGPDLAFNELGSPVTRNGLRLQTSGSTAGNGTSGTEVAVAGLHDQVSYSFGGYRFASDGFRKNNDRDERITNAFVQFRPAVDTSLQFELRSTHGNHGDLALSFDPDLYIPSFRGRDVSDSLRFGARHNLNARDTLLGSITHTSGASDANVGDTFTASVHGNTTGLDLQLLHDAGKFRLQTGLAHASGQEFVEASFAPPGIPPMVSRSADDPTQTDMYGYALIDPSRAVTITAGGAWSRIKGQVLTEHAFNPKFGIAWHPTAHTTVRAAAFRSLFSSLTTSRLNPQPRLEPVQIAGFSQLLFGGAADRSTVQGLAVDHALSERLFVGWEASHRETKRAVADPLAPPGLQIQTITLGERVQRGYLYWTPSDRLGFSATLEHGHYISPPINGTPLFNYSDLTIERLPIELRYFAPTGLVLGFRTSHIRDRGTFLANTLMGNVLVPGGDRFWLVDAFVGYRLPNRRGLLSLNADNLLDRRFRFQDVDPEDSSLIPERLISFRFTLSFD